MKRRTEKKQSARHVRSWTLSRKHRRDCVKDAVFGAREAHGFILHSIKVENFEQLMMSIPARMFGPTVVGGPDLPIVRANQRIVLEVESSRSTYEWLDVMLVGPAAVKDGFVRSYHVGHSVGFAPRQKMNLSLSPSTDFKPNRLTLMLAPNWYTRPRNPRWYI